MRNVLREKIVARIQAGESKASIARGLKVNVQSVYKAWKAYKDRGTTDYMRKQPRVKPVRTESLVLAVKENIEANPEVSIRKLARDHKVPESTMRNLVKDDLGLKSLATLKTQQLTPRQRQGRTEKGRVILSLLKGSAAGKVLVFSDEKDFHIDKYHNRRNSRVIA